ncbi:MAG: hypothetical protein WDO70_09060 [Alphaproteobacteria bacterium]
MNHRRKSPGSVITTVAAALLAFGFVMSFYGAIPFMGTPTLMQAVWTTGFSQSFLNDSIFSIYAKNLGVPEPAAISFGLAGAWPAALLMAAGLHAADAYSVMVILWSALAFFGAYRIATMLDVAPFTAILGAVLWMSMPVVWGHIGYSMLALGFALLPFYAWTALRLFLRRKKNLYAICGDAGLFMFACLISVFMDGYSFVMFAAGTGIMGASIFIRVRDLRRYLACFAFPAWLCGFAAAYLLYSAYLGKPQFDASSIDEFREFSADLVFFLIPTRGSHWFFDWLGLSVPRSTKEFFGGVDDWRTTFCLPVILAGLWAWWRVRSQAALAAGFLLVALFGLYMALGPSLKINAVKPEGRPDMQMSREYAVAPTGSAWISMHVPGFKNMRASCRWTALGVLGLWALVMLAAAKQNRANAFLPIVVVAVLILFNLPHVGQKWRRSMANRNEFHRIDSDLVEPMRNSLRPDEMVAFLPYQNDFTINYLASRLGIRTYNIGGDKNLAEAMRHWPQTMREFHMNEVDGGFADRVFDLLAYKEADAAVLLYLDAIQDNPWYTIKFKAALAPVIETLKASQCVELTERPYYAVVRLKPGPVAGRCSLAHSIVRIASTSGAHNREGDEKRWWHWVERKVSFKLQPMFIAEGMNRTRLRFEYLTRGKQTLTLRIAGRDGLSRDSVLYSEGAAPMTFDEVLDAAPADLAEISIETDSAASPLGSGDPRLAAWNIYDMDITPLERSDESDQAVAAGSSPSGILPHQGTVRLISAAGAHDRESDGRDWWQWVERAVNFRLQPLFMPSGATRTKLRFEYSTRGKQALTLSLIRRDGSRYQTQMQSQGDVPEIFEKIVDVPPLELSALVIETDGAASPLGNGDPRLAAWMVRNVTVSPLSP